MASHAHGARYAAEHRCADGTYAVFGIFGCVDLIHQQLRCFHFLGVHAVFGQILHIDLPEVAETAVYGYEALVHAFYLKAF